MKQTTNENSLPPSYHSTKFSNQLKIKYMNWQFWKHKSTGAVIHQTELDKLHPSDKIHFVGTEENPTHKVESKPTQGDDGFSTSMMLGLAGGTLVGLVGGNVMGAVIGGELPE